MLLAEYQKPNILSIIPDLSQPEPIAAIPLVIVIAVAAGTWVWAVYRATKAARFAPAPDEGTGLEVVTLPGFPESRLPQLESRRQPPRLEIVTLSALTSGVV